MSAAIPFFKHLGQPEPKVGAEVVEETTLATINKGVSRMVDTFIYNYPALVRDDLKPFAAVTPEGRTIKIAIIGSGFAGYTAAYELRRSGVAQIDMYEARNKLGGRADTGIFTGPDGREYANEMGPMRVPENSKLFWHYLTQVQPDIDPKETPLEVFPNPGVVATQMLYEGEEWRWIGKKLPEPWQTIYNDVFEHFVPEELTYRQDGKTITMTDVSGYLVKPCMTPEEIADTRTYWTFFLEKYEDVALVEALQNYFDGNEGRPKWGPREFNMFSSLGFGTGGFGPLYPACFLEIFRLLLWSYQKEFIPNIHMAAVIDKFNEAVRPTLVHKTVTYVGLDKETNGEKVNVYAVSDGVEQKEQYDYVIVATTLRSMQVRMNLDGAVSPERYRHDTLPVFPPEDPQSCSHHNNNMLRQSIRIPHIMNSSKLFGFLKQKPWVNASSDCPWPFVGDEPVKCILTDTLARQMYFLDPYKAVDTAGSNLLISYNWGDDSVKVMGVEDYDDTQKLYPEGNSNFSLKMAYQDGLETTGQCPHAADALKQIGLEDQEAYLQSVFWQKEPMIFGAFKIDYPQQYHYTSQLVYQYQYANNDSCQEHSQRVFLANNNCSFQGGWIEGAMQSAVNSAAAVLKVMSKNNQAEAFRMDELFAPNPFGDTLEGIIKKYNEAMTSR